MANSSNEGRGETSGPAGSRAGKSTEAAAVESTDKSYTGRPASDKSMGSTPAGSTQVVLMSPIVYDFRSNKNNKKRKKYSRGLKNVQRLEDGLTLASKRLGRSVDRGFGNYRKRRNKSARRKKDGAIRDWVENSSGGFSNGLRVASDAPYDVARKLNSKRFGKQFRDSIRFFTRPLFR
jgi:hypothetical protein